MTTGTKHPLLLVDDEPDVLYSLKGLLRREFELFTAESGQQALQILRDHPIHVVMTDQRMPGMTGIELMGIARVEHPDAVRIVFTGYADIKAVTEAINSGGLYRYITKPWDPDELVQTLHDAADRYTEVVQQRQLLQDLKVGLSDTISYLDGAGDDEAQRADLLSKLRELNDRLY